MMQMTVFTCLKINILFIYFQIIKKCLKIDTHTLFLLPSVLFNFRPASINLFKIEREIVKLAANVI